MRGANNAQGIGLVEVYDLAADNGSRLANISTRGFVDDSSPLIGGLISGGAGTGNTELTVRALGPGLQSGLQNELANPALEVRNSDGALLAENDNYGSPDENRARIYPALVPPASRDAATGVSVPAGQYTVIVRGNSGTSGVALVEIYDLNR